MNDSAMPRARSWATPYYFVQEYDVQVCMAILHTC